MSSRKGGKQHNHRRCRHNHNADNLAEKPIAEDHYFQPSSSNSDNPTTAAAPPSAAPETLADQSSPKNKKHGRNSWRGPRNPPPHEEPEVGPPNTEEEEKNPEQEQSVQVPEEAVELTRNGENHEIPEVDDGVEDDLEKRLKELVLSSQECALSEQQLSANDQVQEDELLVMESIFGEDMFILDRQNGLRFFQIHIHAETPKEVTVSVKVNPSGSPEAESSSSEFLYSFKVENMPPITLTCVLPHSYPSHSPPHFTLSVQWLHPTKISSLCGMLDSIWNEQSGQEVIYQWAEWLRSSCLSFLGIDDEVTLGPYDGLYEGDRRVISRIISADADIRAIRSYNNEQRHENFSRNLQECCICYSELPGTEFARLPCEHFFCRSCMKIYCDMHVKEGTVTKLSCPEPKCGGGIPPGLLKVLLGDEEFERWESMMLEKSLESMSDVTYCPRCDTTCIQDGDNEALCPGCFFSFCTLCRGGRHVGAACLPLEMRLLVLKERQSKRQINAEQRRREREYINDILSMKTINSSAKQCPNCKMAIEKNEGCNKMSCRNCGSYFCYICGAKIDGYEHFRDGRCGLFDNKDIELWNEMMNARQVVGRMHAQNHEGNGHQCPRCHQINVKHDNNNHIFCWACQTHYCYLCRKPVLRAAQHFNRSGCKQHTAN